jgi:biopolymer transport protein ExbD
MTLAGGGNQKADINVTPLIDVLLVMLIIFMVVAPVTPVGLKTVVPEQARVDPPPGPAPEIVLSVAADGSLSLNQEPMEEAALGPRLRAIFASRVNSTVFVRGDKSLEFRKVAHAIDLCNAAGIRRVALMTL